MKITFFTAIAFSALSLLIYYSIIEPERTINKRKYKSDIVILFAGAFFVRILMAMIYSGHTTDMNCFDAWSTMLLDGFSKFYSSDSFTDYPPGYMYILYPIGFIKRVFGLNREVSYILLKMPSIICDLLSASVVYKIATRKNKSRIGLCIAGLYLFNPAVILNSSMWGQTDSVYTLLVLLTLYILWTENIKKAYFLFAAAIFVKPQALFYTPILIFAIIEQVFLTDFSWKKFTVNLISGLTAVAAIFLLSVPFGIHEVIEQYKNTLSSYSYASVNAYNFWTAIGYNWKPLTPVISAVGYLAIVAIVAVSAYIFFKQKSETRYFSVSAFICFSTFMLSVKMHDRYAFAAMALMICAFAISKNKRYLYLYLGITALQLLNSAHVLFYYDANTYYSSGYENMAILISVFSIAVFLYMLLTLKTKENIKKSVKKVPTFANKANEIVQEKTKILPKISKFDIVAMTVITLVYAAIALYNLGNLSAPQSYEKLDANTPVTIDYGEDKLISKLKIYLARPELYDERNLTISISNSSQKEVYKYVLTRGSVFCWENIDDIDAYGRYLTLTANDIVYINEIAAYTDNSILSPISSSPLVDEQELVPMRSSFRNSTYFDEIYHARTAYEFIEKQPVYEWTHPPLGKIFISLGIKLFGMVPFGWRIMGTLFGILMIPFIYIFSKKLFGYSWLSVCTTLIFTFDFMHFVQTRIATIDVYVTFFIILMYLFMYKYYTMSFYDKPLWKTLVPLGLSGLSMGFAIACKWTGIYAGAGLAVIFFITLYKRYCEKRGEFANKAVKTIIFCVFAFIIVPLIIYALSYIPFMNSNSCGIDGIIQNQIDMFIYHGKTVVESTHPYSSPWYQWPIVARPIWYYTGSDGNLSENISSFGNPFVWWAGIAAFVYCIYDFAKNRDKNALFLIIAYLAQLVPWMFVTRTTFIYHYFPSVPFVVLMIAYTFAQLYRNNKNVKKYVIIYTIICVFAFSAFYPVLSALPINGDYVRNFLRWFPTWQLIG